MGLSCGLQLGCMGGTVSVPVRDEPTGKQTRRVVTPGYHRVVAGDTLYSIAFASGTDFRALARWNGIKPPYLIRPGQRLRTVPPQGEQKRTNRPPPRRPQTAAAAPRPPAPAPASQRGWVWPTAGRVIRTFSARQGNKGIDIAGRYGQSVRSAAQGRIVYAGSGLRGYGRLIIVKHNETFLSAYAHNRKLLVKEGDRVVRGQPIAEMGSTGTNQIKLHFEIRRRGQPVDPLRYLPKR